MWYAVAFVAGLVIGAVGVFLVGIWFAGRVAGDVARELGGD